MTLRWGIIGCGDVTEVKSGPAFNLVEGFRLEMVMRRDSAKLADYAARHGVPRSTTDAEALIQDPDIDAVYVATPPNVHCDYALKAAAAGKICYVEKPMAMNAAECQRMIEAFDRAAVPIFVAYYRRSLPRFEAVRAWLREGRIGSVRHVHWRLTRKANPAEIWRVDPKIAGGGHFVDLACHGLDLLIHLLGDIADIAGFAANQAGLYAAEDAVAAAWLFAGGATGSGYWNFAASENHDWVEIQGSAGKIEFSVFEDAPTLVMGQEHFVPHPKHIQHPHIENIRRHLAGEMAFPSLGSEAIKTSRLMDKLLAGYYAK